MSSEKIRVCGGKCGSGTLVLVLFVIEVVLFLCSVSVALGLHGFQQLLY